MDRQEFENDIKISPTDLDLAATIQADTFFKWAERAIAAKHAADRAERMVDMMEAKVQMRVRRKPENYGITKTITEAAVKAAVRMDPDYTAAIEDYLKAKEEAEYLDRAVRALDQKKRMIEILVSLHGQEYFAGPSVPRNLGEVYQNHVRKISEKVTATQRDSARRRLRMRRARENAEEDDE